MQNSMFTRKLKSGRTRIYIKFTGTDGKIHWKSTGSVNKKNANDYYREFDPLNHKNKYSLDKVRRIILEDLEVNDFAKNTISLYELVFKDLQKLFPGKQINEFTLADINKYKKYRKAFNKTRSVNIHLRTLRAIFSKARKHGLINYIPVIELLPVKDEMKQRTYVIDQFKEFLAFVYNNNTHNKLFANHEFQKMLLDFCLISFYTGCRRNEVLNIRGTHIDPVKRIIPIEQYKIRGENRFKIVPIHPYLWQMVFQGRELTEERIIPLTPNYVTHKIKVINRLLGLPESLKLHSIRHTYATELMRIDTNRYSIKDLLGHKSVQTSEIYVHTDIKTLHSTNNRLPELSFNSGSVQD
jgi:integrase